MVLIDGISYMTADENRHFTHFANIDQWKHDMLFTTDVSQYSHRTDAPNAAMPHTLSKHESKAKKKMTNKEIEELADLKTRSNLSKQEMISRPLHRKEVARMNELTKMEADDRQAGDSTKEKGESDTLLHLANDKAKKILGTFSDHSKLYSAPKSPEKKSTFASFGHRKRVSKSQTDANAAIPTPVSAASSAFVDPPKPSERSSVASSEYQGDDSSVGLAQELHISPAPMANPRVSGRSRTPTRPMTAFLDGMFDPFAGISGGPGQPRNARPTPWTALHSNAPTDEESDFARALTQRNKAEKEKRGK